MTELSDCPSCGSGGVKPGAGGTGGTCVACSAEFNDALYNRLQRLVGGRRNRTSRWDFLVEESQIAGFTLPKLGERSHGAVSAGEVDSHIIQIGIAYGLRVSGDCKNLSPCPNCKTGDLALMGPLIKPLGWRCYSCGIGGNDVALATLLVYLDVHF